MSDKKYYFIFIQIHSSFGPLLLLKPSQLNVCPLQSSQMVSSKAESLPKSAVHERCFTRVGSSLEQKYYTSLKRPATFHHKCRIVLTYYGNVALLIILIELGLLPEASS